MMGGKDLTLVPSVWWDNAPQTVFESMSCGVPVLGAAVGGIPDFVHHGVNGLLFRGNDREDLKRRLIEVIENPWQLEELRKNVRPCKSIEEHTPEMERIYRGEDVGEMVMSEERVQVVVSAAAGAGSQGAAAGGER
jgi:glycosyltransferase involved in cell wall biosynthesis